VTYHNQCPERVVKKDGGRDSQHGESDEAIKLEEEESGSVSSDDATGAVRTSVFAPILAGKKK
jgi:hypothetical protein